MKRLALISCIFFSFNVYSDTHYSPTLKTRKNSPLHKKVEYLVKQFKEVNQAMEALNPIAGLSLCPGVTTSKQDLTTSGLLKDFLEKYKGCEIFELSSEGIAGDMVQAGSSKISVGDVQNLNYIETKVSAQSQFASEQLGEKYHSETFVFPNKTLKLLHELEGFFQNHGENTINLSDVIKAADRILNERQQKGLGQCYYIFHYKGPSAEELSVKSQTQIDLLFTNIDNSKLNVREKLLNSEGRLNADEIRELRALRQMNEIFESNTLLKNDIGGWVGNGTSRSGIMTDCGDETKTFSRVIQKLQNRGVLKFFQVIPGMVVRKEKNNDHAAIVLKNLRTNELFVYDSWFEDGGNPSRILTMNDWLNKNDDANVVGILEKP